MLVPILMATYGFSEAQDRWERAGSGILEPEVTAAWIDPGPAGRIYAGTPKAVYVSEDPGRTFTIHFNLPTEIKRINDIQTAPEGGYFFAATDAGLYECSLTTRRWAKVFNASDPFLNHVTSIVTTDGSIVIGTLKGLFIRKLDGHAWLRVKGPLNNRPIFTLRKGKDHIYAATSNKLFAINTVSDQVSQIFTAGVQSDFDDLDEPLSYEEMLKLRKIKTFTLTNPQAEQIYLVTGHGVFTSHDLGGSWHLMLTDSLPLEMVTALTVLPISDHQVLILSSLKGVYAVTGESWQRLYAGLESDKVFSLISQKDGLYSLTEGGLFYLDLKKALSSATHEHKRMPSEKFNYEDLKRRLQGEPKIRDVHAMAVQYAEVHPDKIYDWRKRAGKAAWLPSLNIGFDSSRDWSRSDSLWGSSSGSHYVGPDDKTFGSDVGFDVSLSWDLSELVWNPDQTSIDSRSKLMAELREDVLNQVTRLYFERRRIQYELLMHSPEDQGGVFDKKMRVDELTALIDGMTGGEFSKGIEKDKGKKEINQGR